MPESPSLRAPERPRFGRGSTRHLATALVAALSLAGGELRAQRSAAPLGHPPSFCLVVSQFPMGMDQDYFPLPALPILAEEYLKKAGLTITPRAAESPDPPFLRISVVGIRQGSGYVLLAEADLREAVSGPGSLEVSTWQGRRWSLHDGAAPPPAHQTWGAVKALLADFVRQYAK